MTVYEIYTFPHEETDELKITVTPLAADGIAMQEVVFGSVPVVRNKITSWKGSMFNGSGLGGGGSITLFTLH